jgi:hypothetical protein
MCISSVPAGRYKNAFSSAFVMDSAPQIPDCTHIDHVVVALRLDNKLSAM